MYNYIYIYIKLNIYIYIQPTFVCTQSSITNDRLVLNDLKSKTLWFDSPLTFIQQPR